MCQAFSCIATRTKVYYKTGLDSHNDITEYYKLEDDKIGQLIPIEINPKNNDYLKPNQKWIFKFDDECPSWWKQSNETMCWSAFKSWKREVYAKLNMKRIKHLIHPFKLKMVKQVRPSHIRLLAEWDSVLDSVRGSVRGSVWNSVWDSVWGSVRDSIWDSIGGSVRGSVWDSVWGYTGSLFILKRNEWEYTEKIKTKQYPFKSVVKLWNQGLVPSFDGTTWRLHSGKKAEVVFEISKKDLYKKYPKSLWVKKWNE